MSEERPALEDWRNRCERAEAEAAELREKLKQYQRDHAHYSIVARGITTWGE
jgi:hypothetical protein